METGTLRNLVGHHPAELDKAHKNAKIYSAFSERLKEKWFIRSCKQCSIKIKKMCQLFRSKC